MVRMTPEAITERLRAMAEASQRLPSPMVRGADMSPSAVTERLREMADVSAACERLARLGARHGL